MRTARMITRIAPVITLLLLVPASPVSPAGRRVRDSRRPPAPRAPIERVTSELVLIETYVTGADGRPIPDLTSDDFVLLVDGRRSPIASIEYRETAVPSVPPQATQSAVMSVSSSRRFVLFFEDGISAPDGLEAARSAAERFLSSGLGPEDQVAVAAFDRRLRILHDFTSDREALRRTIAETKRSARRLSDYSQQLEAHWAEFQLVLRPATVGNLLRPPTIDNLRKAAVLATGYGLEESPPLVDMLKALRSLVDSLGAWRDYKAIVFMGDGIPENPAARYFDELAKFGNPELLADAERASLSLEVKNLAWAASAAGVVLHTVQTEGLVAGDAAALTASRRRSNTLETLALNTGGIASSSNEPLRGLREADETSRAYYVIGYAPEGPPDGRYHSVQVRCRKSGARVRFRRGFMRLPASEAHARTVQAAYLLPELYPGLGIDFSAIPGPRDPSGRVVDLVIHLPANRILFLPEGGKLVAHLEAGLVALDDSPHETFRTGQKLRIVLDARALQNGRPGIDFYSRVRLPAGAESITAVVSDDAGGVVGGAYLSLAAAQDGTGDLLGLSIYSLADRTLWIELPASPHAGGSAERTAVYAFGPALKTSFAVGEPLACGFLMPGAAGAVPPPLRVAILHGEQIVKSLSLPADQGRPGETVNVPLPVEDLPPGDYLLAVQETEGGRPRTRGAEVFRLQPGDPSGFAAAGTSSPP